MPSQTPPAFYWFSTTATVVVLGWWAWRYARTVVSRPHFERADVVFQEWFASGCSQKNIITKLGGARNCLRLVVTRRFLWVTSWFPFFLIAPFYDMEHLIPLDTILSVRRSSFLGHGTFLLAYRDTNGDEHTLRLLPKKPDDFIRSVGRKVEDERLA
jgi:hypothetical protein